MRYFVRSLKYLCLLCVLYVGLVWLVYLADMSQLDIHPWQQIEAQLHSDKGVWMVVAFVILAALYPLFGFMRSRIDGFDAEQDDVRLINAMQVYGFREVGQRDGVRLFRADTLLRRLMLMGEDTIEVRKVEGGIELVGLRRTVARVAFQLRAYKHNSRFDK